MIIDGHAHCGGEYSKLNSILKILDDSGIDHLILCPAGSPSKKAYPLPNFSQLSPGKDLNFMLNRLIKTISGNKNIQSFIEAENSHIYELSRQSKGRVIQFKWVNPLKKNIARELEKNYLKWNFKGIKLHECFHPFGFKSAEFHNICEFANKHQMPVFIHPFSKSDVNDFITVSTQVETNFIIGHLIGLEIFIENQNKLNKNVFFDISCPSLVSEKRILRAVQHFGAERVILGSDTPYGRNNLKQIINKVKNLPLAKEKADLILGKNMANLLKL